MHLPWVRGFYDSEVRFDGASIAQNDFSYTFNASLSSR